jgi:dihydroorotate dehydrogenase
MTSRSLPPLRRAAQFLMEQTWPVIRPAVFALPAEQAHHVTLAAMDLAVRGGLGRWLPETPEEGAVTLWGLRFPNRVGLAAGLDKTGEGIDGFAACGFGFVEIGTLTPRPQPGNPAPRLFRIPRHEAIINRMGFNNPGIAAGLAHASRRQWRGILGVNIGKNFDTPNERAVDDYVSCLRAAWPVADYVTVNLSSPNTKGLRDLQQEESCAQLIRVLRGEQERLAQQQGRHVPVLIKIAPDLEAGHIDGLAAVFQREGLEGVIATNTTLSRCHVEDDPVAAEAGGLSGRPLTDRSTEVLARLCRALDGSMPVIGVGGIMDPADAIAKIDAGASLVQLYTGLVYRGPQLVRSCIAATAAAAAARV